MSRVFANSLKRAIIQPHFKPGSKTDVSNYRPSFDFAFIWTYLRKIMKIKIADFEKFKILGENHLGFRIPRSTVDALVNVVENMRLEKEPGNDITTVFLYLKQAFDTLNH